MVSDKTYPTYDEIKEAQRQLTHDYSCSRDHCTPEERAVINAAVADREALKEVSGGANVAVDIDKAIAARNILLRAVNELVIARSKAKDHK